MAKMMKPGFRVVRGKDWEYAAQDGNGRGTVLQEYFGDCWSVKWDNGNRYVYRMGAEGKYDLKVCNEYLKSNLSVENCLDVLLSAHLMNQKELFRAASDFVNQNKGKLVRTDAWKEMEETNPKLTTNILSEVLGLQ